MSRNSQISPSKRSLAVNYCPIRPRPRELAKTGNFTALGNIFFVLDALYQHGHCCIGHAVEIHGDGHDAAPDSSARHRLSIRSIVEPRVVPLSLVFMLFAIPYFATQSFLVTYAGARRLSVEVSLFFPCYAVALLIMRIAFRGRFDRKSFRFFFVICSACMLATLLRLDLMNNNVVLIAGAVLMAASYGIMSSVTQAQAMIIAGRRRSGIANSTYYAGIDLGMSLGPIVGGLLYGNAPIQWFYPLFMLAMPAAWLLYAATADYVHGRTR